MTLYEPVPHKIGVLCRDLIAEDNHRDEALSIAEELHGTLKPWIDKLRAEKAVEHRRALRRIEGS